MNPTDLECLEVFPDPVAAAELTRRREMQELLRIAGQSAMANGGVHLDPEQRALAKKRAAFPPLRGPLGTGEPDSSRQHTET